jgi:outer membrane protein assembly factor BamE (lipoprotein component of BamABCDE complex)
MPYLHLIHKREFTTMGILSGLLPLLALVGCDPQAWEEERKRLQPENFEKVTVGMLEFEVVKILGKPRHTVTYALKPLEQYYNWHWKNSSGDAMIFSAIFDPDKIVIRTETWRDPQDPKLLSA